MEMRRFFTLLPAEVVEEREKGKGNPVVGYAARFYNGKPETEFELWPGLVERIMPGAFKRTLKDGPDVVALFNHDPSMILGRRSAETLILKEDGKGLSYDVTPGDTTVGRDVLEHVRRGDVVGSSFGFLVAPAGEKTRKEGHILIRELHDVDLFDVGPVTNPAYEATSAKVRALEGQAKEARKARQARGRAILGALEADLLAGFLLPRQIKG